jgi:hypothetical protein
VRRRLHKLVEAAGCWRLLAANNNLSSGIIAAKELPKVSQFFFSRLPRGEDWCFFLYFLLEGNMKGKKNQIPKARRSLYEI